MKNSLIKYFRRFFVWTGIGLLVLVLLILLLLQTPLAKNFILRTVLEQINPALDGKISATSLSGNLFTHLKISKIQVETESDTLLYMRSLEVRYNPFSFFTRLFKIYQVHIDAPNIALSRTLDGWNFTKLLPASSDTTKTSKADTAGGIGIHISKIMLQQGYFDFQDEQGIIPRTQSQNIFLDASAHYTRDSLKASVDRFDWNGKIASLELNHFFFRGKLHGQQLFLDSLKFSTDSSTVALDGKLHLTPELDFNLHLTARPLLRSDLLRIVPNIPAFPKNHISGHFNGNLNEFQAWFKLTFQGEEIQTNAKISLKPNQKFDATILTRNLNLKSIQGLDLPSSKLFLNLQLAGKNFNPDSLQAVARLEVTAPGSLNHQPIRKLESRTKFRNQKVNTSFDIALGQISARVSGGLNLASARPEYDFRIGVTGPIWYELFNFGAADDQLTFQGKLVGRGFDLNEITARTEILARKMQIQGIQLDSLAARLNFEAGEVKIDSIRLHSPFGNLSASGATNLTDSLVSLNYQIAQLNLAQLPVSLTGDSLAGTGRMTGALSGRIDSLVNSGQTMLEKAAYGKNQIQQLALNYEIQLTDTLPQIDVKIQANEIALDSFKIDTLRGSARMFGNRIETRADAVIDTLGSLSTDVSLELGDSLKFTFQRLDLNALNYQFSNAARPFSVKIADGKITVADFELSGNNQRVTVNGWMIPNSSQSISFEIENLDLRQLRRFSPLPLSGELSAKGRLGGAFLLPEVKINSKIEHPVFGVHHFEELSAQVDMQDNQASVVVALEDTNLGNIINFSSLINFSPDTSQTWPNRLIDFPEIRLRLNALQLSLLNVFLKENTQLKGQVNADLVLHNLLKNLTGTGNFVLNGAASAPALGAEYKKVLLKFEFEQKNLLLDNLSIFTGKGWLKGQGKIGLSKNFDSPFALQFTARNFEPVNSKLAQAMLDADFEIFGSVQQPKYKGKIELERSRINLPPFLKLTPTDQTLTEPEPILLTPGTQPDSVESPDMANLILKDLRGTLSLVIPRNTWLRNEEINIELSGELELIKQSDDFTLFGPVRVIRGNVEFYGKKFVIEKGELVFRGLYPPDPEIYILATFRHPDVMIQLLIGGTASAPQLTLQSSPELEQRDIFSYLLFGKPFAFLSGEEQNDLNGENALLDNAMGIAVGVLAGELTRAVAEQLQLDIIEFNRGADWQSSTLKVGKYVGKGMFVFYSRDLIGGNESVSLEYQINQNWLLKADQGTGGTGGVDLWWQKQW